MVGKARRAGIRLGEKEPGYRSTEDLRREAAEILGRSHWWKEELRGERLQAVLAGLDEELGDAEAAVIATDLEGIVHYWNPAAERLYGWLREETIGRPITGLTVGPEDQALSEEIMESILRTGCWEGTFRVYRRDGSSFTAYVIDAIIEDEDGRPAGIVGVSQKAAGST